MMRFLELLSCVLFASACVAGDETVDLDRISCEESLSIQGSWTAASPLRDASTAGCWPVGTWTFSVAVDPGGEVLDLDGDGAPDRCGAVAGTRAPELAPSYAMRVDRTDNGEGWVDMYTYLGDEEMHEIYRLKVTEIGGGDCEGAIELYNSTGKLYWNLKPVLTGTTITGSGEYRVYPNDAR